MGVQYLTPIERQFYTQSVDQDPVYVQTQSLLISMRIRCHSYECQNISEKNIHGEVFDTL